MTLADQVSAVGAGAAKVLGPLPSAYQDQNGKIQLAYSAVTSVVVEAYKPRA